MKQSDEVWPKIQAFMEGLIQTLQLTNEEIQFLPSLILLRRLDVVLHFLTRYRCNISSEIAEKADYLKTQILKLVDQALWMEEHEEQLMSLLQ